MNANATTESDGTPELLMPQALLSRTAERLAVQYRGIVSEQTVERVVFESYTALRRTATGNGWVCVASWRPTAKQCRFCWAWVWMN